MVDTNLGRVRVHVIGRSDYAIFNIFCYKTQIPANSTCDCCCRKANVSSLERALVYLGVVPLPVYIRVPDPGIDAAIFRADDITL